jgi:hypothetical protein
MNPLPSALTRQRLLLLLAAAAAIRLTMLLAFPDIFAFEQTGAIHGSAAFDAYAMNLRTTGVYGLMAGVPDAVLPPLYSYALAGVYVLFGRGSLQVGLFHSALDLMSIALLVDIGRRIMPRGAWVGWLAGALYAVYPYLVFQNLTLIDTPFFMTLFYAFLWTTIRLRERDPLDRQTLALAVIAGILLGLALLTRPIVLPLAVLIALWFLFRRTLAQTVVRLIPVALIAVLLLVPWIVRNYGAYGAFVPFSINGGGNFYQGNNPATIAYLRAGYDAQWTPPPPNAPTEPLSRDRWLMQAALDYLRANPGTIPELLGVKFLTHWSIDIFPRLNPAEGEVPRLNYQGDALEQTGDAGDLALGGLPQGDPVAVYAQPLFDQIGRALHRVYFGALLALALLGIALARRQWRDVSLLWFVQISMTLSYVVFHPSTRYRVPSDPLLFLFSAYAVVWLGERIGRRTAAREVK